jgi:hypothetical protein
MSTEGKKVFKYLKEHGDSTTQKVSDETGLNFDIVAESLDAYAKAGFLGFDTTTGKYRVKFPLDPPLKEEPIKSKYYDYKTIKDTQKKKLAGASGGGSPPLPTGMPRKWRDPRLKYLPDRIAQKNRGICVGGSAAIEETLKYYKITGDFPTQAEIDAEQRNVSIDLGCPNGKPFVHDIFNKRWKSMQYIYEISRIVGGVTEPSGSYVSAAAESLKIYGSVFETECNTSLSAECVDKWYPRLPGESTEDAKARIIQSGRKHLIDGFATTIDFETICEALYTHGYGCVLIPINIYENYTSNGCVGNYPDPVGEVAGSHAQCVVGYDLDEGTLEFRQTWGIDWSNEGGISKRYFDLAAGAAFIILDKEEAAIGQQLYTKVHVDANVPCTYAINGENHLFTDSTVMLESGVKHTVVATPIDPTKVVEPSQSIDITPSGNNMSVAFSFTAKPEPPTPPVQPSLKELLAHLWTAIKKWLGWR